ncbi:hypothetical protein RDWZM_006306 [Blomia tropicalis]|uniref:Uncharacterized protein n=1 Tax=Blomia tropicalis TaxID=40697 RepID=A0A9Q0RN70_BLOTA|nr:hypothetical protein RDWZM_006306 [Blomia tropicalis]
MEPDTSIDVDDTPVVRSCLIVLMANERRTNELRDQVIHLNGRIGIYIHKFVLKNMTITIKTEKGFGIVILEETSSKELAPQSDICRA